jgi:transcriptional regulator with XRE-family HTH domain
MPRGRMTLEQAFGVALGEARERAGLSQEALALEAGRHKSYVSDLERGKYSASIKTLFLLAKVLEVSPSFLLRRVEELLGDQPD